MIMKGLTKMSYSSLFIFITKEKRQKKFILCLFSLICYYFSILIRASTATTAFAEPNNGFKSISAISGAA